MAGPGGGPPRRSHTKSRKGCETCKRRHIRCDENFPQCRNCTKHKIRCPYNDVQVVEERSTTPDKPDLMWTAEIRQAIDQWKHTGAFPFNIYPAPNPQFLSDEDLRLIYHVASISHDLAAIDATRFTLWTHQIPTIIRIGATHSFVLDALLSFSAMHIAYLTECPLVGNLAYVHRGKAFNGLQEAVGHFSRETSDAVLAASLVLSWHTTDWRGWTQLMQGTSTVIVAMDAWKHESQFGDFIAERNTFPTAPPSPSPDHRPSQPRKEDLDALHKIIQQLQRVETFLKQNGENTKKFGQLITFVKGARKISHTMPVNEQFDRLQPLRQWLFYLPVMYLQETGGSSSALVIIAHLYTVALLMERLFPEIGASYFGSMTIRPVEEIAKRLFAINGATGEPGDVSAPLVLMELPVNTVAEFRARRGWVQPQRTQSFPQFDPPNFYVGENEPLEMSQAATFEPMPPYGENPAFSYSTEDLSVVSTEPGANPSVSPLQMPSPFPSAQYLNIPSPSYGSYSPASSTYGDFGDASSVVYSDNEDYGTMDMCLPTTAPLCGDGLTSFGDNLNSFNDGFGGFGDGLNSFGVGFVPPFQTAWI